MKGARHDPDLSGQVAIVTGGGRGIGQAIALGLARAGAAVTVTARSTHQLDATVAEIRAAGGKAVAVPADVTNHLEVERVVLETKKKLGPVDILVNNAGVSERGGAMWETDPAAWRRTIEVNLIGPFLVARSVLPGMIGRGRGRIINLSSGASIMRGGYTYFSAYGSSKAALNRLTETLATEVASFGVSVFAVHPGAVHTEMLQSSFDENLERLAPGRAARLWDVDTPIERSASLCLFLASGAADGLSGAYLGVNDDVAKLALRADEIRDRDLYKMRINRLDA